MAETYHLASEGVGYLEMRDFNRARWAYEMSHPASPFMEWLQTAGNVSFAVEDIRVDGSAEAALPIPASKLAWEEITRISNELNKWAGVEEAAHDKFGASLLLDLGREVATAVHRWPMEEKPHRITELICGQCDQMTLVFKPPRFEGDEQIVQCPCGFRVTQEEFEQITEMLVKEENGRRKQAMADARRSAKKSA